jgi:hypothetical protein
VIYVNDDLLTHHIVPPNFDRLYQDIDLFLVGRVVEEIPMKYFIMLEEMSFSLHQDYPHGIPIYIYPHFEGIPQFGSVSIGAWLIFIFISSNSFL